MAVKRDYYEVLGLERNASSDEIRKAYRRLARKYHPDVNSDSSAEDSFKEINEAYEVLRNDESRAAYDRYGHRAFSGAGGAPGGDPFGGFGGQSPFSDLFESFFGGGFGRQTRQQQVQRGADVRVTMDVTFEEAIFGTNKDVLVNRLEPCEVCGGSRMEGGKEPTPCPQCGGSGEVRRVQNTILGQIATAAPCSRCEGAGVLITDPCHACHGRGKQPRQVTLDVKVPAGVDADSTLRLTGQGEQVKDGINGNLFVNLRVGQHESLKRQGRTITFDQPLNIAQAVLGDDVEVPTVDGPVVLTIPPGTQARQQFRIRGRGVPDMRSGVRGDEIVTVHVIIPNDLTREQRELFEQLSESLGEAKMPKDKGFFSRVKDALGV